MQTLGRLLLWLGLLLLGALMLGSLALLATVFKDEPDLVVRASSGRAWFAALALIVSLLVLFALARALRAGVQALGRSALLGDTPSARLIGLGAAALVFPQAVWAGLTAPIMMAIELLRGLPEQTRAVLGNTYSGGGDRMPLEFLLLSMTNLFQAIGAELGQALERLQRQVPWVETALALALWSLVGQVLSASSASGAGAPASRLLHSYRALSGPQRYLFWLGTVACAGGLLSIASIVAIPWLKEEKIPAGLTVESLQKSLDALRTPVTDLASLMPQDIAKRSQPLAPLDALLAAPAPAGMEKGPLLGYARDGLSRSREARDHTLQRAVDLREKFGAQQERIVQAALRAFSTESAQPMSAQERLFFFRAIQRQVTESLGELSQGLEDCRRSLDDLERDADTQATVVAYVLTQKDNAATAAAGFRANQVLGLGRLASGYERACNPSRQLTAEFIPPEAGSSWGPFGKMAHWLLRTKSFALALITGMLGFGLLGASIGAYVRSGSQQGEGGEGDIARVVIRGLSAAVVLFLAVKGGLAVLTVGEQDPNAYLLFFLCLVGAVYSEDVWRWARGKFLGRLGEPYPAEAKTTAPAAPPAAPTPGP